MCVCVRATDLALGHEVGCDGHVLEEDGEVQSAVTFSIGNGRVGAVPQQLYDGGQVALPGREKVGGGGTIKIISITQ